jgi:hypothetical protein
VGGWGQFAPSVIGELKVQKLLVFLAGGGLRRFLSDDRKPRGRAPAGTPALKAAPELFVDLQCGPNDLISLIIHQMA